MTKIISIILVLIIIILVAVSLNKKAAVAPATSNTETATTTVQSIKLESPKIADGIYTLNPSDIKIVWTGRKVILKKWIDSGVINLKEGSVEIKDNAIVSNKFVIDMTSIAPKTTGAGGGQDKLTSHLKSDAFFDVEKFPTSTFVAKEIVETANSTTTDKNVKKTTTVEKKVVIKGDMTIKGVTKEISIPVTFSTTDGKTIVAHGSVDLDRTLWDVRYGSGKFFQNLGDNVIDDMFNITFDIKTAITNTVTASTTTSKK